MRRRSRKGCWAVRIALLVAIGAATAAAAERTFNEHCGKCHARPTFVLRGLKGNTEQERRKVLDKFLSTHHAEDPKLRAEIIDYLIRWSAQ
jgi:hypothetical protein